MLLTFSWDWLWDSFLAVGLDFSLFGLWLAHCTPRQSALPRPLLLLLAFEAICMSSDLRQSVADLTAAVAALTSAVASLQLAVSSRPAEPVRSGYPGSCDSDFVIGIVSESYEQDSLAACRLANGHRLIEEGPSDLPDAVLVAAQLLAGTRLPYVRDNALDAFKLGFWAKAALDTHIPYQDSPIVSVNCELKRWIVLRSPYGCAFRVSSFSDLKQFVDLEDRDVIVQSFGAFYQLEAFCSGALIPVPPQWKVSKRD